MIRSFKDPETRKVFERRRSKKLPADIQDTAYRKLVMIHAAKTIRELRKPPGNHLEKLKGDRTGQWSIRINDQWRIGFEWKNDDAFDVEITDYHG